MPEGYDGFDLVPGTPALRTLWPAIKPYVSYRLRVSNIHDLYVEECGNPHGTPVIVLHGGPGCGSYPQLRQFFDPKKYRIIIFDQRGSGASVPFAELRQNTTFDLVNDIECLRDNLDIDRWVVFGGSWGSTLALVYAETFPEQVRALIVRGIYLGERQEVDWFYRSGGIAQFYPDAWDAYVNFIPTSERSDLVEAYWRRLSSDDPAVSVPAAIAWSVFEARASTVLPSPELEAEFSDPKLAASLARIECHYFRNDAFLLPGFVISAARNLREIPGVIVHGRCDFVCQPLSAWRLKEAWPKAELHLTPGSGHAASEPHNTHQLIIAAEQFADAE